MLGVVVQGTIPGHELEYRLDESNIFEKGRVVTVSGNVAACLGAGGMSWLKPHFSVSSLVSGNRPCRIGYNRI